jgi:hypothetical protein
LLEATKEFTKNLVFAADEQVRSVDDDLAAIVEVVTPSRVPSAFEAVDDAGDPRRGHVKRGGQRRGSGGAAGAQQLNAAQIGPIDPEAVGSELVELIDVEGQSA